MVDISGKDVTAREARAAGRFVTTAQVIDLLRRDGLPKGGELLASMLNEAGHEVVSRTVVPDEVEAIRAAVHDAVAAGAGAVLTTGGTGLTPTDVTPEAIAPLLDRSVPGIAEALRAVSRE